jgi:hypothetical protein
MGLFKAIKKDDTSDKTVTIESLVKKLDGYTQEMRNNAACALQEYDIGRFGEILSCMFKQNMHVCIYPAISPKRPIDINGDVDIGGGIIVPDERKDVDGVKRRYITIYLAPETINGLIPLMNNEDKSLSGLMSQVVVEFGSEAVESLISVLNSPDKNIRLSAIKALGEIKDMRALEFVIEALNDNDGDIQTAATAAIALINTPATPVAPKAVTTEIAKSPMIMKVVGRSGTVEVYENKITLVYDNGITHTMARGRWAPKDIFIKNIAAIQIKPAGLAVGYIQFTIPGGIERRGGGLAKGAADAIKDENSITFADKKQEAEFVKLKGYLEKRIIELSAPVALVQQTHQISAADELAKFAELRNKGILTDAEFEAKKKQLLGL